MIINKFYFFVEKYAIHFRFSNVIVKYFSNFIINREHHTFLFNEVLILRIHNVIRIVLNNISVSENVLIGEHHPYVLLV